MKPNKLLIVISLLLALALPAAATQLGTLQIQGIDGPVALYYIADQTGALTEPFRSAPVHDITESTQAVENARILARFIRDRGISGLEQTPSGREDVVYPSLELGLYLVVSLTPEPEFNPFLVSIPTVINGQAIYSIKASPKEDKPDPSDPTGPSDPFDPSDPSDPTGPSGPHDPDDPDTPDIPQTGFNQLPKYALLALGAFLALAGLTLLILPERKRGHE